MPSTPLQALPYPALSDAPNGPTAVQNLATALEPKLVMTFATTAARDAAITAPTAGMLVWTTTPASYWYYTGAAWTRVISRVGCRLRRAATQVIPSGAITAISWDTEEEDSDGFIVATSATITIPSGCNGLYAATLWVQAQSVEATFQAFRNYIAITVVSSQSTYPGNYRAKIDAVEDQAVVAISGCPLVAGDTVQGSYFQNTGANQNLTGAWLSLYRTGP